MRSKSAQDGTQDGPRSPQDGSKIVLDRVFCLSIFASFLDCFLFRFGADLSSQMTSRGRADSTAPAPWGESRRSWNRLGSVFLSSCLSGSLFWSSWAPLGVVFGRSVGRFGAFSAFQLIDSTRQLINSSIQRINSSTYQLINPWPFGTFLPGPADCALRD